MCPSITNPIASGSHIFRNGKTRFLASFYVTGNQAPTEASIFIDGTKYSMTLEIGTAGQGHYYYEATTTTIGCRIYYFYFVTSASVPYYFPETGALHTTGEGTCATFWQATRG